METTSSTNVVAKTTVSSTHQQGEPSSPGNQSLVATNMKYNMKKKMLEKYNNESRSVAIVAPMVMQHVAKQPEPSQGDVCGDDVITEMMSDDSCEGDASVAREAEKKGKKRRSKPQQSLQQVRIKVKKNNKYKKFIVYVVIFLNCF